MQLIRYTVKEHLSIKIPMRLPEKDEKFCYQRGKEYGSAVVVMNRGYFLPAVKRATDPRHQ